MKQKTTLLLIALALSMQLTNAQKTITVDNTPGSSAQYQDLQIAISNANSGDTIYVQPSEINYGDFLVDKPLTFLGFGHGGEKETLVRTITFTENASNCTFRGLHMTGGFSVILADKSKTLSNFIIENCRIDGIMTFLNGGVDNMIIRGNIIWRLGAPTTSSLSNSYSNTIITNNIILSYIKVRNYQSVTVKNNLFLSTNDFPIGNMAQDTGTLTLQNNIFYFSHSSNANQDRNTDGVIFENCLIYNGGTANAIALNGSNNIVNLDPMFIATNNINDFEAKLDDYHLQEGSPSIGAGVGGEDIGLYGDGDFVFNNFGQTKDVPTVKIESITNTVAPEENINLVISTNIH